MTTELVYALIAELLIVALGSVLWVWLDDSRPARAAKQRRREIAKAYPTAKAIRVRVDGWKRERLDINPALRRSSASPHPYSHRGMR